MRARLIPAKVFCRDLFETGRFKRGTSALLSARRRITAVLTINLPDSFRADIYDFTRILSLIGLIYFRNNCFTTTFRLIHLIAIKRH